VLRVPDTSLNATARNAKPFIEASVCVCVRSSVCHTLRLSIVWK